MTLSLPTLPIELVYRIFDNLPAIEILYSLWNVSTRLNAIINSYRPYQVKLYFTFAINVLSLEANQYLLIFSSFNRIVRFNKKMVLFYRFNAIRKDRKQ